ncbi:MAG: hypothetical protein Ct9H300mP15_25710 [Gemmatimonadota bacterium]|nr:MAG: hypothetical protein Ct9H300mP15_25710 [Gemmatimonadota bacterium]
MKARSAQCELAIGVDGGGTWTRAVVVDQDGREIWGRGETEGAVVEAHDPTSSVEAVRRAVDQRL